MIFEHNQLDLVVQWKLFMENSVDSITSLIVANNLAALDASLQQDLLSMTYSEKLEFIKEKRQELVKNCILRLCSKLEYMIQTDYKDNERKYKKKANFQKILKSCKVQKMGKAKQKVYTLDTLIECWKSEMTDKQKREIMQTLKKFLSYRHWLAHGEHWHVQAECDFDDAFLASKGFLEEAVHV